MTARSRTRRVPPAVTFLIRAFAPGCPTMLRSWESRRRRPCHDGVRETIDQLTIFYDLPDQPALLRALELERSAPSLVHVRVGRTVIRGLAASISGEHRTLKVEALLARDKWGDA